MASPGKAGHGRGPHLVLHPTPTGGGEPGGEPGTPASPPKLQRSSLRVGLPHSSILRAGCRKPLGGVHDPPSHCHRLWQSQAPRLRGRFVRTQRARRQSKGRLPQTGAPTVSAVAPGAAIAPAPRPPVSHTSASWVTGPFGLPPVAQPSPFSQNRLAAVVIPLVSREK